MRINYKTRELIDPETINQKNAVRTVKELELQR